MIKRKIIETTEEYNDDGKLIRKTTIETTEDDETPISYPYYPIYPNPTTWPLVTYDPNDNPYYPYGTYCGTDGGTLSKSDNVNITRAHGFGSDGGKTSGYGSGGRAYI